MPLFFLISGIFAAPALVRPWPSLWRSRVAPLCYLLVLWTTIDTLVLQLTPKFATVIAHSPRDLLEQVTTRPGILWYLLALPVYVLVARATRSFPWAALLAALALYLVVNLGIVPTERHQTSLAANLVWFLLGTRLDALRVRSRLAGVPAALPAVLLVVFALAAWLRMGLIADPQDGAAVIATLAVGALGVVSGLTVAGSLARGSRLGAAVAAVGHRTLAVYVMHLPLVALAHFAMVELLRGPAAPVADSPVLMAAYPAAMTAAVVSACLLLHRVLLAQGCWWLFAAPWQPPRAARIAAAVPRHRRER